MPTTVVIPCSGKKLGRRAAARDLYTGPLFRSALTAADALVAAGQASSIRVLSAKHGLIPLTEEIDPYDVTFGDPDAITADRLADQLPAGELLPLLPSRYDEMLRAAASSVSVAVLDQVRLNPLAGSRGIFEQRGRLRRIADAAAAPTGQLVLLDTGAKPL